MGKERSEEFKKFESLNEQYSKDKSKSQTLEADKATTRKLTLAVLDAQDKLNGMKKDNERAKVMGQKAPNTKEDIEKAEKEVKEAEEDLEKHKNKLKDALDKVNTRFEELEKNPEMKKQLDSILAKRMERSIKKRQNDLENYKQIQEIFEKHPHAQNLLKGMVKNRKEMARLDKVIQEIESKPENSRTDEEKQRLQDSKKERTIAENKCRGRELDISEFLTHQYPNLSVDVENIIFDLNTLRIDKMIKGAEKDISNRKNAYQKLTGKEYKAVSQGEKVEEAQESRARESQTNSDLPATITKWQKFKNWIKKAWNGVKEAYTGIELPGESVQEAKQKEGSEFRSAYKYDIVKDYVAQKESELLHGKEEKVKDDKSKDNEASR